MELKPTSEEEGGRPSTLLIVPYGIETKNTPSEARRYTYF